VTFDLSAAARVFAQDVQDLFDGVFRVPVTARDGDRRVQVLAARRHFVVRLANPKSQLTLVKDGRPVASLRILYHCVPDSSGKYLAVARSDFELYSAQEKTPLVRLDYLRDAHTVPSAHWNIHAERGSMSHLLASTNQDHPGQFSKLHFPVGGARMRPCLEDFLQFLIVEFRIDTKHAALDFLAERREKWRRAEIATLVRDAPDEAARVLAGLGFGVTPPPAGTPASRTDVLRRW
jgi:hypothetical protein